MKRLIPFIACLITYAHAQVETFDLTYTLRVQEEAPSSTDEKQPVSFKNQNHAVLTLEKRLKSLKTKKTKAKAKGSDCTLKDSGQNGSEINTQIDRTPQNITALSVSLLPPLSTPLSFEEEQRLSSHLLTDPSKKAAP